MWVENIFYVYFYFDKSTYEEDGKTKFTSDVPSCTLLNIDWRYTININIYVVKYL